MSEEQKINKSIEFKTVDDEKGTVEAVFSVYNTLDTDGDVVGPGAAFPNDASETLDTDGDVVIPGAIK